MKKTIILAISIYCLIACKKENTTVSKTPLVKIIETIYSSGDKTFDTFYYDNNKIKKWVTINTFQDRFVLNINYYNDSITYYYEETNPRRYKHYAIESNGQASKLTFFNGTSESYTYDNNSFLTSKSSYQETRVNDTKNITITYANSTVYSGKDTTTYEYDLNKLNTYGNINQGVSFLGKSNTNLIKSTVIRNNGIKNTLDYFYQFDSNGNVTQEKIITIDKNGNAYTTIKNFTYY